MELLETVLMGFVVDKLADNLKCLNFHVKCNIYIVHIANFSNI